MTKKTFLTIFLTLLFFSSVPSSALAVTNPCKPFGDNYGLVPPPTGGTAPNQYYTITDFFRMIAGIINCLIFGIVPPIAILMLIIGGIVYLFAFGSPETANKGKQIIVATIIGLFLVYCSWLIINTIICTIGNEELCINWWQLFK